MATVALKPPRAPSQGNYGGAVRKMRGVARLPPKLGSILVAGHEGEIDSSGCFTGNGRVVFKNGGNTYEGDFVGGMMHGQGVYVWEQLGTRYEGSFVHNAVTGEGSYHWADGSTYVGGVQRGLRHGHGTFVDAQGRRYEGSWSFGARSGHGEQKFLAEPGGPESYYCGEWKHDCRHGEGTMHYTSGNIYTGSWRDDKKCGKGTMEWVVRRERYTGGWLDDMQHGYGEHIWKGKEEAENADKTQKQMCNIYRGDWRQSLRWGQGEFLYADGSRYSGGWLANKKHGHAIFISASGQVFESEFKNDRRTGSPPPEDKVLAATTRLRIGDLLSGDDKRRAMQLREAERVVVQYNSDLKGYYKHYSRGKPKLSDEAMRTMSMDQFMLFAHEIKILSPDTAISEAELSRLFFRMRRQHTLELAHSNAAPGAKSTVYYAESDEEAMEDPGRPVLFREFVEALVRIAVLHGAASTGVGDGEGNLSIRAAFKAFMEEFVSPRAHKVSPSGPAAPMTELTLPSKQQPQAPAEGSREAYIASALQVLLKQLPSRNLRGLLLAAKEGGLTTRGLNTADIASFFMQQVLDMDASEANEKANDLRELPLEAEMSAAQLTRVLTMISEHLEKVMPADPLDPAGATIESLIEVLTTAARSLRAAAAR
ncbi:unnamed protein product [Chrysoparadoxa australica]